MFRLSWGNKSLWYNPVLQTDWAWLIKIAWGKRRVSSKAMEGTQAYPKDVAGSLVLWVSWIKGSLTEGTQYIVISSDPESGHGARYKKELEAKDKEAEAAKLRAEVEKNLESMQQERLEARASRDFARADAIRDTIVAAGFTVSDKALDEDY